jgi:hypothetical protein
MTWHLNMPKEQKQVKRGHGFLDTVILFLSFRHVEVPGHGLLNTVILLRLFGLFAQNYI